MVSHPIAVIRFFSDVQELISDCVQLLAWKPPDSTDKLTRHLAIYCYGGRHRSVTAERFLRACLVAETLAR